MGMRATFRDWKEAGLSERERSGLYYCSREWGLLREQVKARCKGTCERCGLAPVSHVHHLTYVRKYREDLADLRGLCEPCHEFIHGISHDDPLSRPKPPDFVAILYENQEGRDEWNRENLRGIENMRRDFKCEVKVISFGRESDELRDTLDEVSGWGPRLIILIMATIPYSSLMVMRAAEKVRCEINVIYVGALDSLSAINFAKRIASEGSAPKLPFLPKRP